MPNRLGLEHSPYLLQHRDNPVDWYPWGDEAFASARTRDVPIFLSVGYSTCHWCHVMAHESFESTLVAAMLNRDFVPIKVDREERPDVDRVYMTFVQATTGSGGWPMSVWLTPALEPFYGGTYFPPTSRWGRAGFAEVLQEITRVWQADRVAVLGSASAMVERLRTMRTPGGTRDIPSPAILERARDAFAAAFDATRGGFGAAPKFPRPSELAFLLSEHARTGDAGARAMVLTTLKAMARGGMRDHLGGGFHRYSVDAGWRVPHFEKMLYDQAQLAAVYADAAQVTGDRWYLDVATETLNYVLRDLGDPSGGFASAEDADSIPPEQRDLAEPHASEGAFYLWTEDEVREVAGVDADIALARWGVRTDGNAPSDPHGEFDGRNILFLARDEAEIAAALGRTTADVAVAVQRTSAALFDRRRHRPRPHLDDKVLAAWNGLTIAALARTARTLAAGIGGDAGGGARAAVFLDRARAAAHFVLEHLWDGERLLRRYRGGDAGVDGFAEDYAALVRALLELFQCDGDVSWLESALRLQARQDALFWDADQGGWFNTTGRDPSVLLRVKDDQDGAEPAASSVSALNALQLAHLTGDSVFAERAARAFGAFASQVAQFGRAMPMMLAAISAYHAQVTQLVIAGRVDAPDTRALLRVAGRRYQPSLLQVLAFDDRRARLEGVLPWIAPMTTKDGRATAYVCRGFVCQSPVTTPDALDALLHGMTRGMDEADAASDRTSPVVADGGS